MADPVLAAHAAAATEALQAHNERHPNQYEFVTRHPVDRRHTPAHRGRLERDRDRDGQQEARLGRAETDDLVVDQPTPTLACRVVAGITAWRRPGPRAAAPPASPREAPDAPGPHPVRGRLIGQARLENP